MQNKKKKKAPMKGAPSKEQKGAPKFKKGKRTMRSSARAQFGSYAGY